MMHLAMTRKPMHPRLQAILDPSRLLPTEEETSRNNAELASRLALITFHARKRKARELECESRPRAMAAAPRPRKEAGRQSRSLLTEAQRQKILDLFDSDQWPSLGWIGAQTGASKAQVGHLLESAGRHQPAANPREAALQSVQRAHRFRPEGHLSGQELAAMLELNPKTLSTRLNRARIVCKLRVASVCFYAEAELRQAGILK